MKKGKKMETVKVAIRCRPMSRNEKTTGYEKVVNINNDTGEVFVKNPKTSQKPKQYTFDYAYGVNSTQKQVYDQCASQIVLSVLDGKSPLTLLSTLF